MCLMELKPKFAIMIPSVCQHCRFYHSCCLNNAYISLISANFCIFIKSLQASRTQKVQSSHQVLPSNVLTYSSRPNLINKNKNILMCFPGKKTENILMCKCIWLNSGGTVVITKMIVRNLQAIVAQSLLLVLLPPSKNHMLEKYVIILNLAYVHVHVQSCNSQLAPNMNNKQEQLI